jgi:hypothetical protein
MAEMRDALMAVSSVGTKDHCLVERKASQMASSLVQTRAASSVGMKAGCWAVSLVGTRDGCLAVS